MTQQTGWAAALLFPILRLFCDHGGVVLPLSLPVFICLICSGCEYPMLGTVSDISVLVFRSNKHQFIM